MKKVIAQFSHFCVETNEVITEGMICYYDEAKKAYYCLKAIAVAMFLQAPDTEPGTLQANEQPIRCND